MMDNNATVFLKNLKSELISHLIIKMGRGPVMPGENLSVVFKDQQISGDEIMSMYSVKNAPLNFVEKINDMLYELKENNIGQERGKTRVKKLNTAVISSQTAQYSGFSSINEYQNQDKAA